MRERSTPCVFATKREVDSGHHFTFNDSRVCDRYACVELAAQLVARAAAKAVSS